MIVTFASQKGGPGKSTAAVNVAADMIGRGKSVIIVDCDKKNASSSLWCGYREEQDSWKHVPCAEKSGRCDKILRELDKNYDYVIADTPGHDSEEMRSAMLASDLVVVPMQASQFDIDTMYSFYTLIEQTLVFNENLKIRYYVSNASTHVRVKESDDLKVFMTDYPIIRPLNVTIHNRRSFKKSLPDGLGAVELKDQKAADEIKSLTNAILKQEKYYVEKA